jgi:hypothetical protein
MLQPNQCLDQMLESAVVATWDDLNPCEVAPARRPEMAGKPLSTVPQFPWEVAYMEVLLETDNARLAELISVAQGTLLLRLLELAKGSEREVQAVEDALGSLAILKRTRKSSNT